MTKFMTIIGIKFFHHQNVLKCQSSDLQLPQWGDF